MSWIKRMEACGREGAENPRGKLTLIKNILCVSHCTGPRATLGTHSVASVVSDSLQPHGLPGKNTGVG